MTIECDVAVIGAGPGGYVAAVRAAQNGLKTVCIEKEASLGGTCLNVGCIPSKALLQSTEHLEFIHKHALEHGIKVSEASLDFKVLMQRKDSVVKGLTDSVASLFKHYNVNRILGTAKVVGHHDIVVAIKEGEQKVKARNIILATGSEAVALPFLPFDEKSVVSSTGALALPQVPSKMIVIGGGVIGVELASVYNRLGTDVTIIEMLNQICVGMDSVISRNLLQVLKKQGLKFFLGAKVTQAKVKGKNGGVTLNFQHENKEQSIEGDVVLVAVGRRPYTKGLGLEELGIRLTERKFVAIDGFFRTSIPSIYAIGDIIEGPMLAHKASEEGIAVADIIAGKKGHVDYMAVPNIIYTNPEAAAIGMTEQEAREAGLKVVIGQCYFKGNPRARASGQIEGLVKVIGEAQSKRLVGMHILGGQASELISEGMMAILKKATLTDIAYAPNGHPTMSEAIKEAALQAIGAPLHT